jgi:Cd2+/Zn2+-exporting ATPase
MTERRLRTACTICERHAESIFAVEGMDCRDEVALIERRFKTLPGIEEFAADVMSRRLHVAYDAAKLTPLAIADAMADAGLKATLASAAALPSPPARVFDRVAIAISAAAMGAGLLAEFVSSPPAIAGAAYAVSLAASVPLTWPKARHAVRVRALDINVLMLVAATGAVALGQWSEAAAVSLLFAVAQALEKMTLERARHAVRTLLDLTPAVVAVRQGEALVSLPAVAVPVGARMSVKPGEAIALDGVVIEGHGAVNQAPITGESMPVEKAPGDEVFAGSVNGAHALDVEVTKAHSDTRLARIGHLVERAQASRAPSQTMVERFAAVYTPSVLLLAVAAAAIPPLLDGEWRTWIGRSLVLLVVSCPCALVISTPVSIVAALATAARRGVLIKGGAHLERAGEIRAVAFDKTGTTTAGRPEVVAVHTLPGHSAATLMTLAAAVERRSEHPLADALLRHADRERLVVAPADDVAALPGRGASGTVNGRHVLVGNHRAFEERGVCDDRLHGRLEAMAAAGHTPVLVAAGGQALGVVAVADAPRADARETIVALKSAGVTRVALLTGDTAGTASSVGAAIGVDEVHAELMPEEKASAVERLRERYGPVAMVGDGINDAPALATADLGIAFGGSDTALETADIAVLSKDLRRLPFIFALGRATRVNIRTNLVIALGLKLAFVAAAVSGGATLWMAVLADTGASMIVVANALRLLRVEPRHLN